MQEKLTWTESNVTHRERCGYAGTARYWLAACNTFPQLRLDARLGGYKYINDVQSPSRLWWMPWTVVRASFLWRWAQPTRTVRSAPTRMWRRAGSGSGPGRSTTSRSSPAGPPTTSSRGTTWRRTTGSSTYFVSRNIYFILYCIMLQKSAESKWSILVAAFGSLDRIQHDGFSSER